jgi:hypothetical protein
VDVEIYHADYQIDSGVEVQRDEYMINRIDHKINLFILFTAITAIIFRHVDFFLYPRIYAEEGTVYLHDAYLNGFLSVFHTHLGYYSFIPSFATSLSTFFPLEYAAVVTTFLALVIQVIPFILIYINNSDLLDTPLKKLIGSSVVLFTTHTPEIWLNTITSQFHFVIILFLILIDRKSNISKRKTIFYYILTLIGGFSGIPANILFPIFFYEYIKTKEKMNLYLSLILFFTSIVQIYFILTADSIRTFEYINPDLLKIIVIDTFQYPILYSHKIGIWSLFIILPLIYIFIKYLIKKEYFITFFGASILLSVIMISTSLNMDGGGRYSYAPSVIFIFGLLYAVLDKTLKRNIRIILSLFIIISLLRGIILFPIQDGSADSKKWKRWKNEVILYKKGKIDTITIYPQNKSHYWTLTLPRK